MPEKIEVKLGHVQGDAMLSMRVLDYKAC